MRIFWFYLIECNKHVRFVEHHSFMLRIWVSKLQSHGTTKELGLEEKNLKS